MSSTARAFEDQVVVVTGGGTGLGLEISRKLAAEGARVVIASRSVEHHETLLGEASRNGWRVESEALDVREPQLVRACAERVVARHGRVDALVNNAAGNFVCPAERLSANAWRAVLGIVLDGTFWCSQSFGKAMIARGSGQILNVVATYAWTGMPGVVHSASAKAGVLAMTRTLAVEWARFGVRVNAIAPGPFHSAGAQQNLWPDPEAERAIRERIPLRRFATTEEVAGQCVHLLSPASSYLNGECLVIDGGASLGQGMWQPGERFTKKRAPSAATDGPT